MIAALFLVQTDPWVRWLEPPHAEIRGIVTGPDGRPLAEVRVTATSLRRPERAADVAYTDAAGRFEVRVGEGAYLLHFLHPQLAYRAEQVNPPATLAVALSRDLPPGPPRTCAGPGAHRLREYVPGMTIHMVFPALADGVPGLKFFDAELRMTVIPFAEIRTMLFWNEYETTPKTVLAGGLAAYGGQGIVERFTYSEAGPGRPEVIARVDDWVPERLALDRERGVVYALDSVHREVWAVPQGGRPFVAAADEPQLDRVRWIWFDEQTGGLRLRYGPGH